MTLASHVHRATGPVALPPDAGLPALALSLDPGYVALGFERTGRGRVLECARHDVKYVPGAHCRSSYRIVRDSPQGHRVGFGAVEVTPSGLATYWHDEDPELPWLRCACDVATATEVLRGLGVGDVTVEGATPMRYRPGVRAVVRHDAMLAGRPVTFFARVYAAGAEHRAQTHRALAALPGQCGALVSPFLGAVPALHLTVERAVPGASASALLFDGLRPRPAIPRSIGSALATWHAGRGTSGVLRVLQDDLREVHAVTPVVAHVDPALADAVRRLLHGIEGRASEGAWVPSHGAMRTDQVLVTEAGATSLLDLDGYCWADRSRDVGNLLAYLRWRAIREPRWASGVEQVRDAFLTAYRSASPDPAAELDPDVVARHEAASLLKIVVRRYRSLRVAEWPLVPQLLAAAAAALRGGPARGRGTGPVAGRGAEHVPAVPSPLALRRATDLAVVGEELVAVARAGGLTGAPRPVRASVVSCRPPQRALLRYEYAGNGGREVGESRVVFGKLFPEPASAARAHRTLTALHGQVYASIPDLAVPEPLGLLATLPIALYRPAPGRFLDDLLGDGLLGDGLLRDDPADDAAPASFAAAARWLSALHAAPVALERRLDVADEAGAVVAWAAVVGERLPSHAAAAARLAQELVARSGRLSGLPIAPIHKDFHPQHVVVDGPRLTVIDVDEARMGPPQLDVAHFCAYLHLLGLRVAAPPICDRLRAAFLGAYGSGTGDAAYRFFFGWACLKVARQLATGRGPHPRPVGAERNRQVRAMLAEGLACLG